MHRYASQTPEALELVGELEFVWDQVRANAVPSRSASSSSAHRSVGVPPFPVGGENNKSSRNKKSGRSSRNSNDHNNGKDSRLRVLSPVSQPEAVYQRSLRGLQARNGDGSGVGDDDTEEGEGDEEDDDDEFQDAAEEEYNDALERGEDDDEEHASDEKNISDSSSDEATKARQRRRKRKTGIRDDRGNPAITSIIHNPNAGKDQVIVPRLWRRRVEEALTNMTAEVAAVREQMETRAISQRRRSGLWAWLKWLLWVTLRQILWDVAMLSMVLIWMRARGDRRVEQRVRMGWIDVRNKLVRLGVFRKLALLLLG